jgi:hypothetical protein
MLVRLMLKRGRPLQRKPGKNRHVALGLAALLTPAALMAYVLGFWRLASDIGIAGEFGITGVFSHWQIWLVIAALLHLSGYVLNRYGRGGELRVPQALMFHLFPARDRRDLSAAVSERIPEPVSGPASEQHVSSR